MAEERKEQTHNFKDMPKEVEQPFEFYLPQRARLKRGADVLDGGQGFTHQDAVGEFICRAAANILKNIEALTGNLYTISSASPAVPVKFREVLLRLHRAHIIAEPRVFFDPPFNDEPKLYITSLRSSPDSSLLRGGSIQDVPNWGSSTCFDEAVSKSIGEFLERYFLLFFKNIPTVRASVRELSRRRTPFLDPRVLAGFSPAQKDKRKDFCWDEDTRFLWVEGRNMWDDRRTLLPAQLCFWHYTPEEEPYLREANSNGAAGMFSKREAILAGLKELIQRDNFLIFWLNTLSPPRVDVRSIKDKTVQELLASLERYGFRAEILNTTCDTGIPSFAAVVIDEIGGPQKLCVGAGCDAIPVRAIVSALTEAMVLQHAARRKNKTFALPDHYQPFEDISIGHRERLRLWGGPAMYKEFEWFVEGPTVDFSDIQERWERELGSRSEGEYLLQKLGQLGEGYESYYFEAEQSLLRSLAYRAVKVVVPALVPLYLGEIFAPLGARRLTEVPRTLGYAQTRFPNPLPHPFP